MKIIEKDETVNWIESPPHYNTPSGIECINIIRHLPHTLATAVKYVWRFNHKWDPAEDLGKAEFYLNDYRVKTFESKEFDMQFHKATLIGAKTVMEGPLRTDLRKHIVYLETTGCASASFFNLIYNFLAEAATYETVSYRLIQGAEVELKKLMKVSSTSTEDEGFNETGEPKEEKAVGEESPNNTNLLPDAASRKDN